MCECEKHTSGARSAVKTLGGNERFRSMSTGNLPLLYVAGWVFAKDNGGEYSLD